MKKIIFTFVLLISIAKIQSQTALFEAVLKTHVDSNGDVDYKGLRKNASLLSVYLEDLNKTVPGEKWSSNKAKAFWMNVYNAYSLKLILDSYPVKNITAVKRNGKNVWQIPFVKVGGQTYSLDYIEHKVLRRWHDDPRIHVGINGASKSSPKFVNFMFTEGNVEAKLEELMEAFVNDPSKNVITKDKIVASKIFEWYKEDFTHKNTLIEFINKYSKIKVNEKAKIFYKEHNWTLNDQLQN